MQSDPLAQLRDIHVPAPPVWWPPAPGWWLVATLALAALLFVAYLGLQRRRRGLPARTARQLLNRLYQDYQRGAVGAVSFAHQSNELLKRLLVHGLGRRQAAPASGAAWLQMLDECAGTDEFTNGAGQVLGNARFLRAPRVDVPALHAALMRLLQRVVP